MVTKTIDFACPSCHQRVNALVIDSRFNADKNMRKRVRECPLCETKFITEEKIERLARGYKNDDKEWVNVNMNCW